MSQRIERLPLNRVAVTSFVVCLAVGAVISALFRNDAPVIALALIGIYLLFAVKVVQP